MANPDHIKILKQGFPDWNEWREENPNTEPDLRKADLRETYLGKTDLRKADLAGADLREAVLSDAFLDQANLRGADLRKAILAGVSLMRADLVGANMGEASLSHANLSESDLTDADLGNAYLFSADLSKTNLLRTNLSGAILPRANLFRANLKEADLTEANLIGVTLVGADLRGAVLRGADLREAQLRWADLRGAVLEGADMRYSSLVNTDLRDANLRRCKVYGISVWDLKSDDNTNQEFLIITPSDNEQEIIVDSLEIAQFLYLILDNEKVGHFILVMRTSAVLILGSFREASKDFLNALRAGLRAKGFVPIIFDFDTTKSSYRIETVQTLALLSNFVVVDLSEPAAEYFELGSLVPNTFVPFITIAKSGTRETKMLVTAHHWFANEYIPYPRALEEAKKNIPNLIGNQIMPIADEINKRLRQENNM